MTKNTAIIYHNVKPGVACSDGIAAAWVAWHKLTRTAQQRPARTIDLIGCVYNEPPPDVSSCEEIVIVDFSFDRATIESWQQHATVTLFDHHKTAIEMLGDVSTLSARIFLDLDECGATLAWKITNATEPPAFLRYVRDRDLWNFELPKSEEIHEAVSNLRYQITSMCRSIDIDPRLQIFGLFDRLAQMNSDELVEHLAPLGEKLLAPKREKIATAAARYQLELLPDADEHPVAIPIVRCAADGSEDRLVSDICAKLYRDMPEHLFVACITSDGKYSLRSDKNGSNYDVSAIAKHYSGGGHHNASGFAAGASST